MTDESSKGFRGPEITRRRTLQGLAMAGAGTIAAPALIRSAEAATRTIKVGFISPETGPLAAFGSADQWILEGVQKAVKDGINVGGQKYAVEFLRRDSQSNPSRASEVAGELITGQKVDLMLASSTGDTTNPVSDQCEVNGIPCITTDTPWEAWYFGRGGTPAKGFDWTYHFFWGQQQIADEFTSMWKSIPTNKIVGTMWSNDSDGVALGNPKTGLRPAIAKAGFDVVDIGFFTPLSTDFSAQIAKLKAAKVEIVNGVFLPPDWATFWQQCAQQGYHPKAATPMKALLFPSSVEALGDRGVGLSSEVWWTPNHPFKSGLTGQSARAMCDEYTKLTGKQWVQPLGFKHAVCEVAIDVLKRSKSLKPDAILEAITQTDYHSIVGPVSWKKGPVKNVATTPLVGGQWVKGKQFKYDIIVVDNTTFPAIPTQGKFQPLPA